MNIISVKQDDTSPSVYATLRNADGSVIDLTGATVKFKMAATPGGTLIVDRAVTVLVAASGTVRHDWQAADTATAGNYIAEWEVTFGSGTIVSCPNDSYNTVIITPDL